VIESKRKHLVNLAELQKRLKVSRFTVWRWVQTGSLPKPIKKSKEIFWDLDVIESKRKRLVNWKQFQESFEISPSGLYRMLNKEMSPKFPEPVKYLGERMWDRARIDKWLETDVGLRWNSRVYHFRNAIPKTRKPKPKSHPGEAARGPAR
jgi:predicted DNA-binding transcriptional regulator AlpA